MIEQLKSKYRYDQQTGEVINRISSLPVTRTDRGGYIEVRLFFEGKEKYFRGHRVAWLLHYGVWPEGQLDHINGVKNDNRIENLREVTKYGNMANLPNHRDGCLVGAHRRKFGVTWRSRIVIKGKRIHIGKFDTELEAHQAYIKYKQDNNIK